MYCVTEKREGKVAIGRNVTRWMGSKLKIGEGTKGLDWLRLAQCGAQVGILSLSNEVSTNATDKSSSNASQ